MSHFFPQETLEHATRSQYLLAMRSPSSALPHFLGVLQEHAQTLHCVLKTTSLYSTSKEENKFKLLVGSPSTVKQGVNFKENMTVVTEWKIKASIFSLLGSWRKERAHGGALPGATMGWEKLGQVTPKLMRVYKALLYPQGAFQHFDQSWEQHSSA